MKQTQIIPTSWEQITLRQYIELKQIDQANFDDQFEYEEERIRTLLNMDEDGLDQLEVEEFAELIKLMDWSHKEPPIEYKEKVIIGGVEYTFKGFRHLTLGEFIDLETYISEPQKNDAKIIAVLYRKTMLGVWGEIVFEPYGAVDISERAELFKGGLIQEVGGVIHDYIKFSIEFKEKRAALFESNEPDEEEEEIEPEDTEDEEQERILKKWAWPKFVWDIAGGDLTKIDAVTELGLFLVFNFAAMKKELKISKA